MSRSKVNILQKRAVVFLPPDIIIKIKEMATEKGLTPSAVMRMILMEYLAKK